MLFLYPRLNSLLISRCRSAVSSTCFHSEALYILVHIGSLPSWGRSVRCRMPLSFGADVTSDREQRRFRRVDGHVPFRQVFPHTNSVQICAGISRRLL